MSMHILIRIQMKIVIIAMTDNALLQLLRLSSQALPIGGYAYSQGLETVCDNGAVHDEESLYGWIQDILLNGLAYLDVPVFSLCFDAHQAKDQAAVKFWNDYLLASRETKETLLEDTQMGASLARLLESLDLALDHIDKKHCSLVTLFSLASVHWKIDKTMALHGLLWAWCENQVSIGIKLIPLGQTSGQVILTRLMSVINNSIECGLNVEEKHIGSSCPGAIMASMQHEEQYSRLFRS